MMILCQQVDRVTGKDLLTMAFYKKCPNCGANLDPGEKCDCISSNDSLCVETTQRNISQCNATLEESKLITNMIKEKTANKPQSSAL